LKQYRLSEQSRIRIQYLKEKLRPGNTKFILASEFRQNFVKVYEGVHKNGESYGILLKGRVAVCLLPGELLPVLLELIDSLQKELD